MTKSQRQRIFSGLSDRRMSICQTSFNGVNRLATYANSTRRIAGPKTSLPPNNCQPILDATRHETLFLCRFPAPASPRVREALVMNDLFIR
jgi:hypothetical protein